MLVELDLMVNQRSVPLQWFNNNNARMPYSEPDVAAARGK